ncbi:hypothetical protein LHJ74_07760 [Streptomyces sp. N2-109]|uniref:Uncharacterized protein n=1 Tax=Streptomyces gossypii TaxID=2883101 RepID=A0ABT2JR37_9ACTN|nr:hypothetical protein [Streptomyces gossypii]MCT2589810.1 hypothetical protein [Streptomyces gossypii]
MPAPADMPDFPSPPPWPRLGGYGLVTGHEGCWEVLTVGARSIQIGDVVDVHGAERAVRDMRDTGPHKVLIFEGGVTCRLALHARLNAHRVHPSQS